MKPMTTKLNVRSRLPLLSLNNLFDIIYCAMHGYLAPFFTVKLVTDELLSKECDLTLAELCDRYEQAYGVRVSISTLFNTLERLNITRKKKTFSDPKKESETAQDEKKTYVAQLEKIQEDNRGISMKREAA